MCSSGMFCRLIAFFSDESVGAGSQAIYIIWLVIGAVVVIVLITLISCAIKTCCLQKESKSDSKTPTECSTDLTPQSSIANLTDFADSSKQEADHQNELLTKVTTKKDQEHKVNCGQTTQESCSKNDRSENNLKEKKLDFSLKCNTSNKSIDGENVSDKTSINKNKDKVISSSKAVGITHKPEIHQETELRINRELAPEDDQESPSCFKFQETDFDKRHVWRNESFESKPTISNKPFTSKDGNSKRDGKILGTTKPYETRQILHTTGKHVTNDSCLANGNLVHSHIFTPRDTKKSRKDVLVKNNFTSNNTEKDIEKKRYVQSDEEHANSLLQRIAEVFSFLFHRKKHAKINVEPISENKGPSIPRQEIASYFVARRPRHISFHNITPSEYFNVPPKVDLLYESESTQSFRNKDTFELFT